MRQKSRIDFETLASVTEDKKNYTNLQNRNTL